MKRTDYISWDEYFLGIAMLAAKRSKDPNTQVGACIVSPDNIIISTGYNGDDFLHAVRRCLKLYHQNRDGFRALQYTDMSQDFSWDKPAERYMALFDRMCSL